ncbi:MAG: 16S rRNA (guanine(966)-N(2))-methyltransferase RsmD [Xanthomonadales bacterium]|nr:16S rRNA (guanine(966)-N(2))-methyltransferase RsmD [Xanthomonadales bacterium]MCP5474830.1 16S rRNA (guanine(966)-N(2))-methyltransferase RsmD [Rhodanobacteraceae bacterium]
MGEVRIIGGSLKRSKLPVPDRPGLRPTPDRVRETLFNWLGPSVRGARALDLCAGTGVLGLEALSRGADFVHFNETDFALAAQITSALERFRMADRARVTHDDARQLLAGTVAGGFDLVFVDPPYQASLWPDLLPKLPAWLNPAAKVYVEHPIDVELALDDEWRVLKQARAGRIHYCLLQRTAGSADSLHLRQAASL